MIHTKLTLYRYHKGYKYVDEHSDYFDEYCYYELIPS